MGFGSFMTFLILAILALVGVQAVMLGIRVTGRIRLAVGDSTPIGLDTLAVRQAAMASAVGRGLAGLSRFMPLGEKDRAKIVMQLRRAGFEMVQTTAVVLGAKFALVMFGIGVGIVFLPEILREFMPGLPTIPAYFGAAIGGVMLGALLNVVPELVVARLAAMRTAQIEVGFADAMDLLIVCLRAGMTFERGLQRTVADLTVHRRALAGELRRASLDMTVHGRSREEAMNRLAARLDLQVFKDLATTVSASERYGTPLAEALATFAKSARVEAIASMQARIARLPVLLVLPTLTFVLPGIIVIVGGPAFVSLTESLTGVGGG